MEERVWEAEPGGIRMDAVLALTIFIGTAPASDLTAFVGAVTAAVGVVTTIGVLAGNTVEWVIRAHERRTPRSLSSADTTHSLRCSLCDTPRIPSRSLLLCAVCDGATSS